MKLKLISLAIAGLVFNLSANAITSPTAQGNYTVRVNGGTAATHFDVDRLGKITQNPKIAELQIGNFVQDNFEIFGEVSRYEAKGKKSSNLLLNNSDLDSDVISTLTNTHFSKDKSNGFYVGGRYYFTNSTNLIPYLGAKAGFIHHSAIKKTVLSQTVESGDLDFRLSQSTKTTDIAKAQNKLSAGALAGVDYQFAPNISFGAGVEYIVSGKRNIVGGGHSSLVRYTPVFASVKYTFDI